MTRTTSKRLTASLHIDPLPCPRPRITVRGRFAHAYYPKEYATWKAAAEKALKKTALAASPIESGRVLLTAHFFVERPRTTKLVTPKPDIDNYLKSLLDAMTQAGVWSDDSQVVRAVASKRWASKGRIVIAVEQLPHLRKPTRKKKPIRRK